VRLVRTRRSAHPFSARSRRRNIGEYPARLKSILLWVRGPDGENLDSLFGGAEPLPALRPGAEHLIARSCPAFGDRPGRYVIGSAYISAQGNVHRLTATIAGATSQRDVTLWRQSSQVVDKWVDVPESATGDVRTGIVIGPGDDFALTGEDSIWSGLWFAPVNGPEGFTDRLETNTRCPMNNVPQAHPYSLVGHFEGEPYFYIGRSVQRRSFDAVTPKQLFLRINDDTPGNGSGKFRCRIQVWR
jgi:hypothetical protein